LASASDQGLAVTYAVDKMAPVQGSAFTLPVSTAYFIGGVRWQASRQEYYIVITVATVK